MTSDAGSDAALLEIKKARHRLVGAVALCLLAAVLVPLLLESEPRDAARALPITIESAFDASRPETPWIDPPTEVEQPAVTVSPADRIARRDEEASGHPASPEAERQGPASGGLEPVPMVPPPPPPPAQARPSPEAPADGQGPRAGTQARQPAPAGQRPPATPAKPRNPALTQNDEDNDTLSRLIEQVNRPAGEASGNNNRGADRRTSRRFLLQVGAYSSVKSARAASERVSRAGLSAYHETVKTGNGDWIRVRIGPFASREEAEQAQQALRRAGVVAALIAL